MRDEDAKRAEDAKWHWAEGIKIALEGMKICFMLNGAAAISVLTFIGNTKTYLLGLLCSLLCFSFGSMFAVITMFMAYKTQLDYGNICLERNNKENSGLERDNKSHRVAYCMFFISILLFFAGIVCFFISLYN